MQKARSAAGLLRFWVGYHRSGKASPLQAVLSTGRSAFPRCRHGADLLKQEAEEYAVLAEQMDAESGSHKQLASGHEPTKRPSAKLSPAERPPSAGRMHLNAEDVLLSRLQKKHLKGKNQRNFVGVVKI